MKSSLLAVTACFALLGAVLSPAAMACYQGGSSTPPSGYHTTPPPTGTTPSGTTPTPPAPPAPAAVTPPVVTPPPAPPAPTPATATPASPDVSTSYTNNGSGKKPGSPHPSHQSTGVSPVSSGTAPSNAPADVDVPGQAHVKGKTAHGGNGVSPASQAPSATQVPAQPAGQNALPASSSSLPFTGMPLLLLTLIAGSLLAAGVSIRGFARRVEKLARR